MKPAIGARYGTTPQITDRFAPGFELRVHCAELTMHTVNNSQTPIPDVRGQGISFVGTRPATPSKGRLGIAAGRFLNVAGDGAAVRVSVLLGVFHGPLQNQDGYWVEVAGLNLSSPGGGPPRVLPRRLRRGPAIWGGCRRCPPECAGEPAPTVPFP